MNKKFYITSAIPYVNSSPHVGHAQEFVYADVIRRYHKLLGQDVLYLCGADENALKIVQAAEKAGKPIQEFTDIHQGEFLNLIKKLDINLDVWQRATDKSHHTPSSQKLWKLCYKNGDIYKKKYTGLYCVGCESFYTKDEIDKNGECFEHSGKKLDKVSEENYFFRLSKYQKFLEELLTSKRLKIIPEIRKNEALAFIRQGLEDFSISRSRERAKNWGIPIPNDSEQIMYVWFDALNIYQTGIGFGWDEKKYKKWWPQDVMVIGKGIIRFHAIYWPAILKSAGLDLPKNLFVHGYLTVDGQKMSKTLGNVVDPIKVIDKYRTDPLRYYLLREIPSYSDGDFSERRFKELYNSDLANGLGNLVARVAKLCETDGIKGIRDYSKDVDTFKSSLNIGGYTRHLERYEFNLALEELWMEIKILDQKMEEEKPWSLSKIDREGYLKCYVKRLLSLADQLQIFIPQTSEKILKQFSGEHIKSQAPLFPRIK